MSEQLRTPLTLDDLRERRDEILALAAHYGAYNVRVFGSIARSEATSESDVDLLVQFPPTYRLLQHAGFVAALKDLLGSNVDVPVEQNLRTEYRQAILQDAVTL